MGIKKELKPAIAKGIFMGGLSEFVFGTALSLKQPLTDLKDVTRSMNSGTNTSHVSVGDVFHPLLEHPFQTILGNINMDMQPLCFLVGVGFFSWHILKNMKKKQAEDAHEYNSHGNTRWATKSDIFDKRDITDDLESGAIILARYNKKKLILLNEETKKNKNIAVFGGAGTGKTQGLIKPNIVNITDRSIVVTDPKGELLESCAEIKRLQGFEVIVANFSELEYSIRYECLSYIRKPSDANKIVETIVSNATAGNKEQSDFWGKAEKSLLSALILYVKYVLKPEQQHMGSVYELLTSSFEHIHFLYLSLPDTHIAKRAYYQAISKLRGKTAADVFTTASVTMDLWKYPEVCDFTYTNDFNFHDLAHKKVILFVIMPIAEARFRPLISTFFDQMFGELYHVADHNNNKLPVKVKFLIDEFCNIGRLPQFTERLSTMRSYGMSVMLVIQSLGQLRHRWGQDLAEEIIDNCDTRIYLGANNTESAEYFAKMIGRTTIQIDSESNSSGKNGSSESSSLSFTGKQLMMAEDLQRLDDDTLIVLMRTKMPMLVRKAWLHEIDELNSLLGEPISRFKFPFPERTEYDVFQPRELIKKLFEANGNKPLDLADFGDNSEMIINSADPEYQLKKAKEERAQKENKKREKKSVETEFVEALNEGAEKEAKKREKKPKQEDSTIQLNILDPALLPEEQPINNFDDADYPTLPPDAFLMEEPPLSEHEQAEMKQESKPRSKRKKKTVPADEYGDLDKV